MMSFESILGAPKAMPKPLLLHLHSQPCSSLFHHCRFSLCFPNLKVKVNSPKLIMSRSLSDQTPHPSSSTVDHDHDDLGDHDQNLSRVLRYHNATKHGFTRYARGPHGLDWANQPNPFRRYLNAPLIPLLHNPNPNPSSDQSSSLLYSSVFLSLPPPSPLSKPAISQLFYDSLALSAWKRAGLSTWSLRVNPSSGNLHPTEAYIVSPPIESVSDSAFVAHYAPKEHALELRAELSPPRSRLFELIPENSFLIGLSSIFWREAWKYGERAFRYCNHDVGHAIAAVAVAAAAIGFDVKLLDGLGHGDMEKLMGLDRFPEFRVTSRPVKGKLPEIEFEHPDCILAVFPSGISEFDVNYEELSKAIAEFSNLDWKGEPNSLSKEHVCWDVIYRTAEAVKKTRALGDRFVIEPFQSSGVFGENPYKGLTVREIVRKRRSAVDMDGATVMKRDTFYQILLHCLPSGHGDGKRQRRPLALPFRALPWDAEVHAALFVHRVEGLHQGLYFLVRNEEHFSELKRSMRLEFNWTKPDGCPNELPLYELDRGDYRLLSQRLSCHQEIASDGCFSLGMVAHFEPVLREKVWMYPRLFWETGVLGQVLYLEAHAVGISATGIGCYFDDPVHEVLGLKESNFQSLYHFTLGGPVVDKRIMSLPAYPGPNIDA